MNTNITKVTIYEFVSFFGFKRIEAQNVKMEVGEYAQYRKAVNIEFIPRGEKKAYYLTVIDDTYVVVLDGWGHPEFENYAPSEKSGPIIRTGSRFPFFSSEDSQKWYKAFDAFLNDYLTQHPGILLADYRNYDADSSDTRPSASDTTASLPTPITIETTSDEPMLEGAIAEYFQSEYERNPEARRKCIEYYGLHCSVCGFDFEKFYGAVGKGFIHVHHLVRLADKQGEYQVDPIEDLRPVCPNCHAMLHRRTPPYTVDELRTFLSKIK